ncbi:ribonuclease HII [Candidatus Protochlamydia naegleriophila]|uniref:Ribonuclease HII n=1 Tax=Candidatus Protochlamydia naegleriophila TaxID=389348 RepID=A0A0U5CQ85_9BACT|nr:ribonuclease HII [Candidatus Protochlamydia naegleriophila]CUI17004.1 ribonuclease HII [Candidatus Protochlamydia naegleriophila]
MPHSSLSEDERLRLVSMTAYEEGMYLKGYQCIAGIDEAGRGPLAGPVVAAACILPRGLLIPQVNDSKKLTPKIRERLFGRLLNDPSVRYGIGIVEPIDIDRINIYQATIQAMLIAVQQLPVPPDCLLVDGMPLPHPNLPCLKIIKGDQLSQSIAAASIIAKETRDRLMNDYHLQWPQYGFNQHKGYATERHLEAILQHGPCQIHRRSFDPIKSMIGQGAEVNI